MSDRYINPEWLQYATDEEIQACERWLAKQKTPRSQAAKQLYSLCVSLITHEVERRWERQPRRKGSTDPKQKRKTRQVSKPPAGQNKSTPSRKK
jgi:hypothetical protein